MFKPPISQDSNFQMIVQWINGKPNGIICDALGPHLPIFYYLPIKNYFLPLVVFIYIYIYIKLVIYGIYYVWVSLEKF